MKENAVSFKVAKLAKEAGYNLIAKYYYDSDNPLSGDINLRGKLWSEEIGTVWCEGRIHEKSGLEEYKLIPYNQAPTQTDLQDWIIDNYRIYVIPVIHKDHAASINNERNWYPEIIGPGFIINYNNVDHKNRKSAMETGLLTALEIIKNRAMTRFGTPIS